MHEGLQQINAFLQHCSLQAIANDYYSIVTACMGDPQKHER